MNIADIREDYTLKSLGTSEVDKNPIDQFKIWFQEALEAKVLEPNAMTLATVNNGQPKARIVLLKGIVDNGFTFFTNYNSDKGQEIAKNPQVSTVFFWPELQRQIRIEGSLEKLSSEESKSYFLSRPKGSQIGAWASNQSEIIKNREVLEEKVNALQEKYKDKEVDYPTHWGGYLLTPVKIEFWQGRSSRLHDRIVYTFENGTWKICRVSP